jgi:CBS domain-containing protein
MKAVEIMTTGVVTVQSEASVREAARLMLEHRVSGLPQSMTWGAWLAL